MIELAPNNPYGLSLARPVLAAAGCLGYAVEYARTIDLRQFGAVVTRTTTLSQRQVARPPRLLETPAGLISVGPWPNPGIEAVLRRYAPQWATFPVPMILSIGSDTTGELIQLCGLLEGVEGIAAVELAPPADVSRFVAQVAAVRRSTFLPLLVKLPPLEAAPLLELAQAAANAGADALVAAQAPLGSMLDPASGERLTGWLSGPALVPQTLLRVATLAPQLTLPLIACGGVSTASDVQALVGAGAIAVQIGAPLLATPTLAGSLAADAAA